ncbi:MAG: VOC family protein, partial [Thermoleophilaceae bacterium]
RLHLGGEKPGPPAHDEATAEQVRELVTKGALGMAGILTVDDVHAAYEELKAKGVEFTEEPTERFYGTDCGLRDPFGNHLRIGTPKQGPIEVPDPARFAAENG